MNQFNGIGNLTADPELRKTANNLEVCEFTIAINEGYGEKKITDYIDCVAWRTLAENLCKYERKGDKVAVQGKLKKDSWTDKEGKKHYRSYVLAGNIEFLNTKRPDIMSNGTVYRNDIETETVFDEVNDVPKDNTSEDLSIFEPQDVPWY